MSSLKQGGSFQTFNDADGNPLASINRDGTVSTTGIDFADGTQQTTAGGGGSGVLSLPTAGTASPTPVYTPDETPALAHPSLFVQDIDGNWHAQAGIDTTSAEDSGSGPLPPAGILTWFRRMFFRDTKKSTQMGKNAFLSVNHTAGIGTAQTNQDRAIWVSMGNITETVNNFHITGNVLSLVIAANSNFVVGMPIVLSGFGTSTYLNGVLLTVASVSGGTVTANFTHADVGTTIEPGLVDQVMYSMANLQMETDVSGSPTFLARVDGEITTLSLQMSDNHIGNISAPQYGVNCIRSQYYRQAGAGIWTGGDDAQNNVKLLMTNNSAEDGAYQFLENLLIRAADYNAAPHLGYIAIQLKKPAPAFSLGNFGLYVSDWGNAAGDYAIFLEGGRVSLGPNDTTSDGTIRSGKFTVAALPAGLEGQTAYATDGRKVGEGAAAGTGVPTYFSNGQWRVYSTDAPVAA